MNAWQVEAGSLEKAQVGRHLRKAAIALAGENAVPFRGCCTFVRMAASKKASVCSLEASLLLPGQTWLCRCPVRGAAQLPDATQAGGRLGMSVKRPRLSTSRPVNGGSREQTLHQSALQG